MKVLVSIFAIIGMLLASPGAYPRDPWEAVRAGGMAEMRGEYFGQPKPGPNAEPFALSMLAARHDHYIRAITFSPEGGEAYWPVIDMADDLRRWIVGSRLENGVWTEPSIAAFSKKAYYDDVPCLSPSGSKLLFLSGRPLDEGDEAIRENIWCMNREGETWSDPVPLPGAVNSSYSVHQQTSLDREDHLYFGGEGADGYGSLDIYCSKFVNGEYQQPMNLGPTVNGPRGEYAPSISPDGSYLIFTGNLEDGWSLFISFKTRDGSFTSATDLRESIRGFEGVNLSGSFVTSDGKYLIFFGERDEASTPYWTDTSFIESLRAKALGD